MTWTTSSTRSTRSWRRMPRILCVVTYKKGENRYINQVTTDMSKQCKDCALHKPLAEFPRNASRPDGYGIYCKACYAMRYRAHRERKAAKAGRTLRPHRVNPPGEKWCPGCQGFQRVADFPSNRSNSDGL